VKSRPKPKPSKVSRIRSKPAGRAGIYTSRSRKTWMSNIFLQDKMFALKWDKWGSHWTDQDWMHLWRCSRRSSPLLCQQCIPSSRYAQTTSRVVRSMSRDRCRRTRNTNRSMPEYDSRTFITPAPLHVSRALCQNTTVAHPLHLHRYMFHVLPLLI